MGPEADLKGFTAARALVDGLASPLDVDLLSAGLMTIGESVTDNGRAGPFLGQARRAITGQAVSPPLFESMAAMGRERCLARLDEIIAVLGGA